MIISNFQIPKPVQEKRRWPWEPINRIENLSNFDYPKITIITPSLNQGVFIEETIRSIIIQGYPNLEYMIFDGGSKDQSVEIIKKYNHWITYWESEPDRGQAHAINKGLMRCSGDIVGWINSDDMLMPGSLFKIGKNHLLHNDLILLGDVINFNQISKSRKIIHQKNVNLYNLIASIYTPMIWHQPGVFVPTKFLNSQLMLDENLRFFFDHDWLIRLILKTNVFYMNELVALFRLHPDSKTINEKFNWLAEHEILVKKYWDILPNLSKEKIQSQIEIKKASFFLGETKWDRKLGIQKLIFALKIYPKIAFSLKFFELLIRSILPLRLIISIRSLLIKFRFFFPNE